MADWALYHKSVILFGGHLLESLFTVKKQILKSAPVCKYTTHTCYGQQKNDVFPHENVIFPDYFSLTEYFYRFTEKLPMIMRLSDHII